MARLRYWVRDDASGLSLGEGIEERPDFTAAELLAHVQARQPAGRTVFDTTTNPQPSRVPNPLAPKLARLAELRAKGWVNLTVAEREEARGLIFDLGGSP